MYLQITVESLDLDNLHYAASSGIRVNRWHGILYFLSTRSAGARTAQQPAATPRPSSIKQTFLSPWSTVVTAARRQHDQDPALSGEPPPCEG